MTIKVMKYENKLLLGNIFACILFILFWTAAYSLKPDPRGFGTHEQLFLPPCIFRLFIHLPCPACGLTTSFAHLLNGNFFQAFHANRIGPFIFIVMLLLSSHAVRSLIQKKNFWNFMNGKKASIVSIGLMIGLITNWILTLLLNSQP